MSEFSGMSVSAGLSKVTDQEFPAVETEQVSTLSTSFTLLHTLTRQGATGGELFGWSVGVSVAGVIAGVPCDDAGATDAGAAYLFDATTGTLLQTFQNPDPRANDNFGLSVSASPGNFLIGAPYQDAVANNAGTAYLFNVDSPAPAKVFQNPAPSNGDLFGRSVATSGTRILVGAPFDDTNGTDAGRFTFLTEVLASSSEASTARARRPGSISAGPQPLRGKESSSPPLEVMWAGLMRDWRTCSTG